MIDKGIINKYCEYLKKACNETRLDYFPQVEASELLYRVITLEDIYLPLSLTEDHYEPLPYQIDNSIKDVIRRIDEKIKALDADSAAESVNADLLREDVYHVYASIDMDASRQILIEADPGSGKTTLCKRLVLAFLNKDDSFFYKYLEENKLDFNKNSIPILLSCKHISEFSNEELETLDFKQIMYRICMRDMGVHFSELCESEFVETIADSEKNRLCIILDGWDEILKEEKEVLFCNQLRNFANNNNNIDIIISSRFSYIVPELGCKNSRRFRIRPLTVNDIAKFCQLWYEKILSPNHNRNCDYTIVTSQILRSKDPQIVSMRRNPLELSLLLTVSKNDGILPENKAILFEELVGLYIFWSTNKNNGVLSSKTIRVFLAYIATYFTKHKLMICSERTLRNIIKLALSELEYAFTEDAFHLEHSRIAKELSNTGILTRTYNGKRYSFSESRHGTHRQLQEYLTAYAILAQYADEEYNSIPAIEILEDKYTEKQWTEVIIFMVLMRNGRVRQEIIDRLIAKCKEHNDNYYYTNLLFSFVIMNADIKSTDKHKIYDSVFIDQITDQQISYIFDFIEGNSRYSADFIDHIANNFLNSINNGRTDYVYAHAVIEASKAWQNGDSPFELAHKKIMSEQKSEILTGLYILSIMSWCKYQNIRNEFASCYLQYIASSKIIHKLISLTKNKDYCLDALNCIEEMIIADFAKYSDFFICSDIDNACSMLADKEYKDIAETILSLSPLYDLHFQPRATIDSNTKNRYTEKLNREIEKNDSDNIVFTFGICVALGCFSDKGLDDKWREIREIYSHAGNGIEKAYYSRLDDIYLALLYEQVTEKYVLPEKEIFETWSWNRKVFTESFAIYHNENESAEMKIIFPKSELCEEARTFFDVYLSNSLTTYNNLAYLLRRHSISSITIDKQDYNSKLSPDRLLGGGVRVFSPFSTINYALTISNIRCNYLGNYNKGKRFLNRISPLLNKRQYYWNEVIEWWSMIATEKKEYEGLVVLSWLFDLKIFDIEYLTYSELKSLSRLLSKYSKRERDFSILYDVVIEEMKKFDTI